MKTLSLCALAFAGLALVGLAQLHADPAASNSPPGNPLPPPLLDHDEMTQLNAAHQKALSDNPDLQAEEQKLKAEHDSTQQPTEEQRSQTFAEWKSYHAKLRTAMLKIDPTLKPIFAKIDAAHAAKAAQQ